MKLISLIIRKSPPYIHFGRWYKPIWFVPQRNEVIYVHRIAWPLFSVFAWLAFKLAQLDRRKTWIQREIERITEKQPPANPLQSLISEQS